MLLVPLEHLAHSVLVGLKVLKVLSVLQCAVIL